MARRRNSNRRRRRGGFGFLYKLLSTVVICVVLVVALTLFFRVDAIVVTGAQRYTEQEVIAASGVELGDNLYLLNKNAIAGKIPLELPYIERVYRINRQLPDTLIIEVEECGTPLALVQDGSAWLISPRGKIVDQQPASAAEQYARIDGCELLSPTVGAGKIALATEYAAQQQSLLDLLAALEERELLDQVDAIHLGDISTLTMDYAGRFTVELPYHGDYVYKLRALEAIIGQLESNQTGTIQMDRDDGKFNFIEN